MWYEKDETIQKDKPIFAKMGDCILILLPQIKDGYKHTGFNWFNLKTGEYNSCVFFNSIDEAVRNYRGYKIYNGEIQINT